MHSTLFQSVVNMWHMALPNTLFTTISSKLQVSRLQNSWAAPSTKNTSAPEKYVLEKIQEISCPYEYLLHVYGNNHFRKIIHLLDPTLEERDPKWVSLILEIMDAIHFGAILVDDVADNSMLRKGHTAAHRIFGCSETINRAYLRIFEIVEKCSAIKPSAIPFILDNLTQIHKGQDDSLVWRRDGFDMSLDRKTALATYKECASEKTGALFRLVGQLVTGSHEKDDVMSSFGWYCQLQNDCKNVFSSDVITAKGALAEDLANGEYSFPILVALYSAPEIRSAVSGAMCRSGKEAGPRHQERLGKAALMLQKDEVRVVCLTELEALKTQNMAWASLWGRKEEMLVTAVKKVPVASTSTTNIQTSSYRKTPGLMGFLWRRFFS